MELFVAMMIMKLKGLITETEYNNIIESLSGKSIHIENDVLESIIKGCLSEKVK